MFDTIRWEKDAVVLIDQRVLPTKEEYVRCADAPEVAAAISGLTPRRRTLATISQRLSQLRRLRRGGPIASDIRVSLEVGR